MGGSYGYYPFGYRHNTSCELKGSEKPYLPPKNPSVLYGL
jgi:hypothetical protein